MSADSRDARDIIADVLMIEHSAQSAQWGADAILAALSSAGWSVAKLVPSGQQHLHRETYFVISPPEEGDRDHG